MGTDLFAKVLCKSRDLCGNFYKAKSPTYYAVCIYALTGFSVPSLPNTHVVEARPTSTTSSSRHGTTSEKNSGANAGTELRDHARVFCFRSQVHSHIPHPFFWVYDGLRGMRSS